jgi:hypothetical protein
MARSSSRIFARAVSFRRITSARVLLLLSPLLSPAASDITRLLVLPPRYFVGLASSDRSDFTTSTKPLGPKASRPFFRQFETAKRETPRCRAYAAMVRNVAAMREKPERVFQV